MLETLLIIPGVARSKYARSAPRYERQVRDAASKEFGEPLREKNLSVEVHHFYTPGNTLDLDNLLKCILDGLKGAAFEDDSQVVKVSAERYNISRHVVELPEEWVDIWTERVERQEDFVLVRLSRRQA